MGKILLFHLIELNLAALHYKITNVVCSLETSSRFPVDSHPTNTKTVSSGLRRTWKSVQTDCETRRNEVVGCIKSSGMEKSLRIEINVGLTHFPGNLSLRRTHSIEVSYEPR